MYLPQATKITFAPVLPTGSGDTNLFNTAEAYTGRRQFRAGGIRKFVFNIVHDQAGVLRLHKSSDRFVSNDVEISNTVVAAGVTEGEFLVELYDDFRVVFENSGTDQGVFEVDIALSDDRAQS